MAYLLVEEASCESARLDTSLAYRIVLSSSWNPGPTKLDTKSLYVHAEPVGLGGRVVWTNPFGDKSNSLARPLTITLVRASRFKHGDVIASYSLESSFSDCIARPVVLSPQNDSLELGITIRLVITVSRNPTNPHKNDNAVPSQGPTINPPINTSHSTTPSTSDRNSILQPTVKAETSTGSESLIQPRVHLAGQLDPLQGNGASMATSAATGLASAVVNLKGMVDLDNLLDDVHPLVKGACSLVKAVYEIARAQANLDASIEALINAITDSSKLAKLHAPVNRRFTPRDLIVRDLLREIIKGAILVKVYCKKLPENLSALQTIASDLAQEVNNCFYSLSVLNGKFDAHPNSESQPLFEFDHATILMKKNADDEVLKEMLYAVDANRALRDGSRGCLFGTRTDIMDGARDWALDIRQHGEQPQYLNAFDPDTAVFWLCGVAGAGKSSIMISLAIMLHEMGLLGSMYSFQAANQAALNPETLFSTISRHLAQHNPLLRKRLLNILRKSDPIMRATSSPKDQFENFVLALLAHTNNHNIFQPIVIIIDGFDECGNIGSRREILNILTRRAHEIPPGVRILITSRYEPDVQDALASQLDNVCLLKMEHVPKESTEHDINKYVHDELKDVRGVNAERFAPQLTKLALAAQESFQWASTACKFIQDEDDGDSIFGPEERLSQVLQSNQGLDHLYRTVLDRDFGASKTGTLDPLLALLGFLAYAREPLSLRNMISLITASSTSPTLTLDNFHRMTRRLSSLVIGTEDLDTPLVVLHTSFTDFLHNEERSTKYFVDPLKFHQRLAASCLHVMDNLLRFNICNISTSFDPNDEIEEIDELLDEHIPGALSYACNFWAYHLSRLGTWSEIEGLRKSVTALLSDRVLEWLEVMSLTASLPLDSLGYLEIQQIPSNHSDLSDLVREVSRFVAYFVAPIMTSAAHIYLSALPFTPTGSIIFHRLRTRFRRTVQVTAGALIAWPTTRHILASRVGEIYCVAFSPIGHLVASGSHYGPILLLDTTTGSQDGEMEGHTARVSSVAFSPDGSLIVSGSEDKTIRIWDVRTCTAVGEPLEGHAGSVVSVVFSLDGTLIASGSDDKTIRIWNVRTHTAVGKPLEGHSSSVGSVAFSPDGTLVASGSDDQTIRIWDVRMRTAVGEPLMGYSGVVYSVAFSPDGTLLASGSHDGTIRIWYVRTRTAVGGLLEQYDAVVLSVAFSPDGALIASGLGDSTIRIWDVRTRTAVGEPLEGHAASVGSVAFSPDGTLLASGSHDRTVRIWDLRTRNTVGGAFKSRSHIVRSVAFSPNGALTASGLDNATIRIWDVNTLRAVGHPLEGHTASVLSVAFSPDGTLIASGSDDTSIRIWDVETRTAVGEPLEGHLSFVCSVAFSPDGMLIASASEDETIRIWDVKTRIAVGEPLMGHSGVVHSVAFSPNGKLIASGSDNNTIHIWDVQTLTAAGKPLEGHTARVFSVAFSPDGSLIVSGSEDQTIRIWDVKTRVAVGEPLMGHSGVVHSVAFSPNGTLIASGSDDRDIRIWDVKTRTDVGQPLEGHTDFVNSIAFSPDGALIASGSWDKSVRIWNVSASAQTSKDNHRSEVPERTLSPLDADLPPSGLRASLPNFLVSLQSMRNLEDGWITGPLGELILWIPPTQRLGLGENRMLAVLGDPKSHHTLLNFEDMACGSDWTKCRTISS